MALLYYTYHDTGEDERERAAKWRPITNLLGPIKDDEPDDLDVQKQKLSN